MTLIEEASPFDWEAYFKKFPHNYLSKAWCKSCRKTITVAETEPIPEEQAKLVDGMAAHYLGSDDFEERFFGWLCFDCAWKLAGMTFEDKDGAEWTYKAKGGISGGGGLLPEFCANSYDLSLELVTKVESAK